MVERTLKILCVTSYYKPAYVYGGPARSVPQLCESLVKAGADVTVFTVNSNGPGQVLDLEPNVPINVDGVEVYYFSVESWADKLVHFYFYSPNLKAACESKVSQFDLIYVVGNWGYPGFEAARAARKFGVPYIISPRASLMKWAMGEKALKKRIYLELIERRSINKAVALHVTSYKEEREIKVWNLKPPVYVIPNGVEIKAVGERSQRGRLRQSLGIPDSSTVALFVGRLHKVKRLDLMVEAFAQATQEERDSHLVIVGPDQDGSGRAAKELALQLGVSEWVHLMGQLEGADLDQAYVDADFLVLLSYGENFGMVVVEAMAAGLPVLLSQEVGLAEEVEKERAGFVVNANPKEAADAWCRLISDHKLRAELSNNARELVWEHFESGQVASHMLELCESLVEKQGLIKQLA